MYAGAAREAVFSKPEVIRRINGDFVALALRAPSVNRPDSVPDKDERWLYERINRAKLAPQGIGVLKSDGQVLAWVQMFDKDQSVLDFLEHSLKRFQETADAKEPVVTQRYGRFPSDESRDLIDKEKLPAVIADGHAKGKSCPAKSGKEPVAAGSILARLVGRALDDKGKPVADTVNQEHYAEDQFGIAPAMQQAVAKALANEGTERVRLPDDFSKLCATHAHLGHIDVQPCLCMIKGKAENKGEWKRCEFWAWKVEARNETTLWQVEGESEVVSDVAINGKGVHNVELTWEGFIDVKGTRMTQLLLSARGKEKLEFAKDDHPLKREKKDEVAFLPGGRPVDVNAGVRYGIIGEPVAGEEPKAAKEPANGSGDAAQEIPEEARRQFINALGGAFLVFRDKVLDELKVSDDQKKKLRQRLPDVVKETMDHFQKIEGLKPQEREKEHQAYRQKAQEKLAAFLKETLKEDQLKRLRQVELQQEGAFALGRPDIGKELKITDEQRKQFMAVVEEMQKKIEPLIKEAQSGGNPQEIMPKVMKIRKEHEGKIEALLTDAQKKQWQEMLGKRLDLDD